jgi:hypothetical protein
MNKSYTLKINPFDIIYFSFLRIFMSEMHQISDTVFQSRLSSISFYCQLKDQDSSFLTFLGIETGKAEDKLTLEIFWVIKNKKLFIKIMKRSFIIHCALILGMFGLDITTTRSRVSTTCVGISPFEQLIMPGIKDII